MFGYCDDVNSLCCFVSHENAKSHSRMTKHDLVLATLKILHFYATDVLYYFTHSRVLANHVSLPPSAVLSLREENKDALHNMLTRDTCSINGGGLGVERNL
jgi:hypothetical protein